MWPYLLLLVMLALCCYMLHKTRNTIYHIVITGMVVLLLALFSGLRDFVGFDYLAYYNFYTVNMHLNVEPVYLLIRALLKLIHLPAYSFFLLFSFATVLFVFKTVSRYSTCAVLSILLFLLLGYYNQSMNLMRQWLAVSIYFFYACQYIKEGSFKKYAVAVLIASMFHYSAVVTLPFYYLVKQQYRSVHIMVALLICTCANFCLKVAYTEEWGFNFYCLRQPFWMLFLYNADKFIVLFAMERYRKRLITLCNENLYLLNFFLLSTCCSLLTDGFLVMRRLGLYASVFSLLVIPLLLSLCSSKKEKQARFIFIILFYIPYYYLVLMVNEEQTIPYKSLF